MNRKALALIVLIIVLVIAGIAIAVGVSQNNENTNNLAQNESNTGTQVNTEELGQTANDGTDTNTASNETDNTNTNTSTDTNEGTNTPTEEDEKILVVYFSQTGNTETVANFIHEAVGGDIVKLETEQTYTSDYNELLDVAQEERRNNARPALRTQINNIDEYHLHMKVEQFVERRRILNK